MKKILTLIYFIFPAIVLAQGYFDVIENEPFMNNGVEYSFAITNETTVKEYNRYEVALMATNKSGCALIYIQRNQILNLFEGDPAAIARFECINANGKRLSAKGGNLKARSFTVPYTHSITKADGKTGSITENIHAGYILGNGQSVSNSITVLTDGDRPRFKVRIQNFTDLTVN